MILLGVFALLYVQVGFATGLAHLSVFKELAEEDPDPPPLWFVLTLFTITGPMGLVYWLTCTMIDYRSEERGV